MYSDSEAVTGAIRGAIAVAAALALLPLAACRAAEANAAPAIAPLRVCADPNNLPFSNDRREGFENAIAQLIADDLHRPLAYTWWPQRRGFARNTLQARQCDLIVGIPSSYELAAPTHTYYRSTYVFVTRRDRRLAIRSLDDRALRRLKIGVHLVGDDYANVPPAQALVNRHMIDNIVGFTIYGDYSKPNPPAALIDAVAAGTVDVAIAWGPLAGYFSSREPVPLDLTPIEPPSDGPNLPFTFAIAMGVRRDDKTLHAIVDDVLARRAADIHAILERFGVPLVGDGRREPSS